MEYELRIVNDGDSDKRTITVTTDNVPLAMELAEYIAKRLRQVIEKEMK